MTYPDTSTEIVVAARDGDERALERLIDDCLPSVLRWCARLGGPKVDAEDAAHDALLVVVTRIGSLRVAETFPYWLFGITRNVLRSHRRKAWVKRWVPGAKVDVADPSGGPARDYEMSETSKRVAAVLDQLPQAQREVLVLCELEERSSSEASALLGIPQGTVKSRLRLARARFVQLAEATNLAPELTSVDGAGTAS
jgi:RNA polymerase sigma-70 factor (ECF subfamily)